MKYPPCPRCNSDVTGVMIERPQVREMVREKGPKEGDTKTSMKRSMGATVSCCTFPCRHNLTLAQFSDIALDLQAGIES